MNKRYCRACGAPVKQQARFCGQCGLRLGAAHASSNFTSANRSRQAHLVASEAGRAEQAQHTGGTSSRWRHALLDQSTLALLVSNVIVIAFAIIEHWNLITLLWIYWAQSVIIGVFNVFKILDLERFSTDGFYINGKPVAQTEEAKRQTALFFALHYGLFHLVYFVFLVAFTFIGFWEVPSHGAAAGSAYFILGSVALFGANHLYSYLHNREQERERMQNIGGVMFSPYARIIPMQLTLILGIFLVDQVALLLFLTLKTVADVIMHVAEHARNEPTA